MNAPPAPAYPETSLLRGGVGMRIAKPIILLMTTPLLIPIGIYGLYDQSWGMAAFFLVPPIALIFIFGVPLRHAGSFELTSHRLRHKPWLRPWREYALAAMPLKEMSFDGSMAQLRVKSIGLNMTFLGSFDALRGALAVWCVLARLPMPPPSGEPWAPWIMWPAATTSGRSRRGFVLLLGDQLAFVPETFPPPSTGAAAAGLAINLLTLPFGVAMVPVYVHPPIADVLRFFFAASASVRQCVLDALAKLMGGWAVGVSAARCTATPGPGGAAAIHVEVANGEPVVGHVNAELLTELSRRMPSGVLAGAPTYR